VEKKKEKEEPHMKTGRLLTALVSAAPQLWLGWMLYGVLHSPLAGTNRLWATDAWLIMVMEFFLVHAGFMSMGVVMMREPLKRALVALGLGSFYALFFTAFWFISEGSPIVLVPAILLVTRLVDAHGGGHDLFGERAFVSVTGVVLYLIGVFATAVPDPFPAFGFTPEVIAEIRPASEGSGGLWIDEPQRVVVFAAAYFFANGLLDVARGLYMARRAK
jgi:hypothetical protein